MKKTKITDKSEIKKLSPWADTTEITRIEYESIDDLMEDCKKHNEILIKEDENDS